MKKTGKKVISALLAALMVLTMAPFTAFAKVETYSPIGSENPNIVMDFGLFRNYGTDDYYSAVKAADNNLMYGYFDNPLSYNKTEGTLTLDGKYNSGTPYKMTKGDYFTASFRIENINTFYAMDMYLKYNTAAVEPAGQYTYKTGSGKNATTWYVTESAADAEANGHTLVSGGYGEVDGSENYTLVNKNDAGNTSALDDHGDKGMMYITGLDATSNYYDCSDGTTIPGAFDVKDFDAGNTTAGYPEGGSVNFKGLYIVTFAFKIIDDTQPITFGITDDEEKASSLYSYLCTTLSEGTLAPAKYTTHADEGYPGSGKLSFMKEEAPAGVVYTFADGSTKTVTDGTTPANTATKYVDKNDKTHDKTTYAWVADGSNFKEEGTTANEACSFDNGVVTKAPTATEDGVKTYTCSLCGHQYTEAIPAVGVVYTFADGTTKTVTDGTTPANTATKYVDQNNKTHNKTTYAWVADGANFKEEGSTTNEACSFDDGVVTKAPTATEDGVKTYTCSLCGHQYTEAIPASGVVYEFADGTTKTVTDGTTPANTATKYVDKNDGTHDKTTYAWVANGENFKEQGTTTNEACSFGEWVVTKQPTCTETGTKTRTCSKCGYVETESIDKVAHDYDNGVVTKEPTYKEDGVKTFTCKVCGDKYTEAIPATGCNITVKSSATGTVTFNGDAVTADTTKNVKYGNTFSMTATPADGETFIGWAVGSKIVSTNATFNGTAYSPEMVYTPVFDKAAATQVTATFLDSYSNIIKTYTAADFSELTLPEAPVISGYTFDGWSMSLEDIKASTESVTVVAQYTKDATTGYTVTVPADVTVEGTKIDGTETYAYDTQVTVSKTGAKAWKITGTDKIVGYGESYSFYVGSNIDLTPVMDETTAVPTVNMVSTTKFADSIKVAFLATRTTAADYKVINAGFVYGKNMNETDLSLEKVGQTGTATGSGAVKVIYAKDASSNGQFQLNYGCAKSADKPCARAFIVYANADGSNVKVAYTGMVAFDYNA